MVLQNGTRHVTIALKKHVASTEHDGIQLKDFRCFVDHAFDRKSDLRDSEPAHRPRGRAWRLVSVAVDDRPRNAIRSRGMQGTEPCDRHGEIGFTASIE